MLTIPRLADAPQATDENLPAGPGWWIWLADDGSDDGKVREFVMFRCPHGHDAVIGKHHSIERDGRVSPSLVCTCGKFHEFVTLDCWPADKSVVVP